MTLQRDASHGEINKIRVKGKSWWFVFLFILLRCLQTYIISYANKKVRK